MKRSSSTALLASIFALVMLVSGCGKKDNDVGNGDPGIAGPVSPAPISPYSIAGGAVSIAFTAINAYSSGVKIVAGSVMGSGRCQSAGCFCGYFNIGGFQCWTFANSFYQTPGIQNVTIGTNQYPVGQPGTIQGFSKYDANSAVALVLTPSNTTQTTPFLSDISGVLSLSQEFVYNNFPNGIPSIIGIALDLGVAGSQITEGGVLIYTSQDQFGYHGAFLRM